MGNWEVLQHVNAVWLVPKICAGKDQHFSWVL